jgi:hypothetical protein
MVAHQVVVVVDIYLLEPQEALLLEEQITELQALVAQ